MLKISATIASDEADWRRLWGDYLAFYETVLPEPVYATSFARLIDPAVTQYNGLIARLDGEAVGIANYIFHRHGWQVDEICYLQDLFVASGARGAGAGRALLQAVFDAADAAGRPNVYWLTQTDNTRARRLYDAMGSVTPFIKYRR
ncbi:MAG: GNAT family N-acetyltransferase [Rhodovulum sulfidophilum]|uniref:GNAT family N-acetyltransferase n=1 Tax=Rhodovulum sulfidophilum TaxID=35806 RepID=A0A2W5QCQ4_RHOSU|nr:MAG: GNAT family N-acetyltransferase [Rhodovulum sulfidophilum]